MSQSAPLQQQFDQKLNIAMALSEQLEQGQADTPLTHLFQQIRAELQQKNFAITLLCLNESSRKATLKWLYGQDFAVFSVQISAQVGLLEVHLKDRGYSVEKSTGERLDFARWEELVQALEDKTLLEDTKQNELRIATQTPTAIKQLDVLVPESPAFIQQSPALITRLLRDSNVLMVAAPPNYALNDAEQSIINTLLEDMACFIPLMPVNELADDMNIPAHGWWEQLKPRASLPFQLLTTHVEANLPGFLTSPNDDTRQILLIQQLGKKYQRACEALTDQFEDTLRQLNSRKKREQRKQQPVAVSSNINPMNLRNRISDNCTELAKAAEEASRKRELLTSENATRLKSHVDTLDAADIDKEAAYKSFKLSLGANYQRELMNVLNNDARQDLGQDVQQLQNELASLAEELTQSLNKQLGYRPSISLPKLDKRDIWHDLEQVLAMEVRYQGEMPKRGFMERLGAGRQAMMGLMMMGMVVGGLVPELRQVLMIFGLPLFIVGVAWSFINFPKEEKARMDKELKRVRDEILNNARRLHSDVNRRKTALFKDFLDKLKKEWAEQVDKIVADAQQRQQQEHKKNTGVAQQRLKGIDQQLMQMQQHQTQLKQLKNGADQLLDDSARVLQKLGK